MRHDRYANAVEARVLVLFQLLELTVREVSRMWIERRQHSLNRCLGRFLVVDVAGVVLRDRRDGFVVVLFDLVGDAVGRFGSARSEAGKVSTAADRAAEYRRDQNDSKRRDDEFPAHP